MKKLIVCLMLLGLLINISLVSGEDESYAVGQYLGFTGRGEAGHVMAEKTEAGQGVATVYEGGYIKYKYGESFREYKNLKASEGNKGAIFKFKDKKLIEVSFIVGSEEEKTKYRFGDFEYNLPKGTQVSLKDGKLEIKYPENGELKKPEKVGDTKEKIEVEFTAIDPKKGLKLENGDVAKQYEEQPFRFFYNSDKEQFWSDEPMKINNLDIGTQDTNDFYLTTDGKIFHYTYEMVMPTPKSVNTFKVLDSDGNKVGEIIGYAVEEKYVLRDSAGKEIGTHYSFENAKYAFELKQGVAFDKPVIALDKSKNSFSIFAPAGKNSPSVEVLKGDYGGFTGMDNTGNKNILIVQATGTGIENGKQFSENSLITVSPPSTSGEIPSISTKGSYEMVNGNRIIKYNPHSNGPRAYYFKGLVKTDDAGKKTTRDVSKSSVVPTRITSRLGTPTKDTKGGWITYKGIKVDSQGNLLVGKDGKYILDVDEEGKGLTKLTEDIFTGDIAYKLTFKQGEKASTRIVKDTVRLASGKEAEVLSKAVYYSLNDVSKKRLASLPVDKQLTLLGDPGRLREELSKIDLTPPKQEGTGTSGTGTQGTTTQKYTPEQDKKVFGSNLYGRLISSSGGLKDNQDIVAVEIGFDSCSGCRAFARDISRLAKKYPNVKFITLDTEKRGDTGIIRGIESRYPGLPKSYPQFYLIDRPDGGASKFNGYDQYFEARLEILLRD